MSPADPTGDPLVDEPRGDPLADLPADVREQMREREADAARARSTPELRPVGGEHAGTRAVAQPQGHDFRGYLDALPRETQEAMARVDARVRVERRADALAHVRASIPRDYRWAFGARDEVESALGDVTPRELAVVQRWCEAWWDRARALAGRRSAAIQGPAGAGKTALGVRMLRAYFDLFYRDDAAALELLFVHASDLAEARMQHPIGHGEAPLVREAIAAEILLLDDVGQPPIEPTRSAVPDVIEKRHALGRTTWITTGLSDADVAARYGTGIARRVFERCRPIDLTARPAGPPAGQGIIAGSDFDARRRQAGDTT